MKNDDSLRSPTNEGRAHGGDKLEPQALRSAPLEFTLQCGFSHFVSANFRTYQFRHLVRTHQMSFLRGFPKHKSRYFICFLTPPKKWGRANATYGPLKHVVHNSGILHSLLEIPGFTQLAGHPVFGASWEGWCVEQITAAMRGWRPGFYRTSGGAEVDLVLEYGTRRLAFQFKASAAPKVSRGLRESIDALQPERTWPVAPVSEGWEMPGNIRVASPAQLLDELSEL